MNKRVIFSLMILLSLLLNAGGCTTPTDVTTGDTTTQAQTSGSIDSTATTTGDTTSPAETEPIKIIDGKERYPNLIYQNKNTVYLISPDQLPNDGMMFADLKNYPTGQRSGHVGHAMVEYADGKLLSFYSSCNLDNKGHSLRGWMEYKRSEDGGLTWSEPYKLPYSYDTYFNTDGARSVLSEKATVTADGTIIVFNLETNIKEEAINGGYYQPTFVTSKDGGYTWSEGKMMDPSLKGRILDTVTKDNIVYVIAKDFSARRYALYRYDDNGGRFILHSFLTLDGSANTYATLGILKNGNFIAYAYNVEAKDTEYELPYCISDDNGKTWSKVTTAHFAKRLRNPQMNRLGDTYFMFGRSGNNGDEAHNFVMYCSDDGITWDEGTFVSMKGTGTGAYSNTLVVGSFNANKTNRLLVMASRAYLLNRAEVIYWWIDMVDLK